MEHISGAGATCIIITNKFWCTCQIGILCINGYIGGNALCEDVEVCKNKRTSCVDASNR